MTDLKKGPTGRIKGVRRLLSGVTRSDVLEVLNDFTLSKAAVYGFTDSIDFDLVHDGVAYPPKAVLGLSALRTIGRPLTSDEFWGGEGSPCFAVLRALGFVIQPKGGGIMGQASTRSHPFQMGKKYHRKDVFTLIGLPEPTGGPWFTGYASHAGDWFIFCGVGTAGRTGHDHRNKFEDGDLLWYGKSGSSLKQPSIQGLLYPTGRTYIFCREDDRQPFTFAGVGAPKRVRDTTPVEVLWSLRPVGADQTNVAGLPEEIPADIDLIEGAKKSITVNAYERDRTARVRCIAHWGLACVVCGFDFRRRYGELGEGFIHVHHLKPLSEIGQEYRLDPVADLRPVCPNCHAMLHRGEQVLRIEQLRQLLQSADTI